MWLKPVVVPSLGRSMNYFLVFYLVVLLTEVVVSSVIKYQLYDFKVMSK